VKTKVAAVGGSVPMPHDLDGTWCKVIGVTLGYALLVVNLYHRPRFFACSVDGSRLQSISY